MNDPYGGTLVDQYSAECSEAYNGQLPPVYFSDSCIRDAHNIASGAFSPLTGFMNRDQFNDVCQRGIFGNLAWTIPIIADIDADTKDRLRRASQALLCKKNGQPIGLIDIEDIFEYDKERHCLSLFGTLDRNHPGVQKICQMSDYCIGGLIRLLGNDSTEESPRAVRQHAENHKFKSLVGFQTRNVIHRGHEYIQRSALESVDGLLIQPLSGWKKKGDFTSQAIRETYQMFIQRHYPAERIIFSLLETDMRYAGPKEAVFHAIIRKNFGCTHFIVGRDHAGVASYYQPDAAISLLRSIRDLGIEIMEFPEVFFCGQCSDIATEITCAHDSNARTTISASIVRQALSEGKKPDPILMREDVYSFVLSRFDSTSLFY